MKRVESRTPRFVVFCAAIGVLFLGLPILGLMKRVAWSSLWSQLTDAATLEALRISLYASVCATAIALVLGLPLAWVLFSVSMLSTKPQSSKIASRFSFRVSPTISL